MTVMTRAHARPGKWGTLVFVCAVTAACNRGQASSAQPEPEHIPLAIALGACPNLAACERECDAGSADRCRRLAASYALGQPGLAKDETRASSLYEHACKMGDPSSCVFAGQMYEFARGVTKDEVKAADFYEQACNLKWAAGCYNLGIMYERGTGVPANVGKATDLYQAACDAGAATSCERVRELMLRPIVGSPTGSPMVASSDGGSP
jgi:TPR repeat protein